MVVSLLLISTVSTFQIDNLLTTKCINTCAFIAGGRAVMSIGISTSSATLYFSTNCEGTYYDIPLNSSKNYGGSYGKVDFNTIYFNYDSGAGRGTLVLS